jgi:hypothetical protein
MRRASGGSAELDARPLSGGRGSGPAEVVTGSEAPEAAEILAAEQRCAFSIHVKLGSAASS